MIKRWLKTYFSIIFVFSTMLGILHHHNDLKIHNDCQICTIQSNFFSADTPSDTLELTKLEFFSEATLGSLFDLVTIEKQTYLHARAPPKNF